MKYKQLLANIRMLEAQEITQADELVLELIKDLLYKLVIKIEQKNILDKTLYCFRKELSQNLYLNLLKEIL